MDETYFNDISEILLKSKIFTIFLIIIISTLVLYRKSRKKHKFPPGPSGVPFFGYLPFLGLEPYKELNRLKYIYGNVFSVYMGRTPVVILGDYEAVKDAFSKSTTTDRPEGIFDILPDAVGFSSINGKEWEEQRKFCVKSMREHGIGKDKWENMIQMEVEDFINTVSSYKGQPFEFNKVVASSVSNNISSFVFGKRFPPGHPDRIFLDNAMEEIMLSFSQASIIRFFPFLWNIAATLGIGSIAKTKQIMINFNNFFRKEVEKMKQTYKSEEHDNFIVDYLKEMEKNEGKDGHYFNDTNLLGNIQALFLGGSDTTMNSISWLIVAMAKYPDIQTKVQNEIDSVLGKDNRIQWSDRRKIPYTYATILEGQRWRTLAPLNTARIAMEDIKVQNYDIPKGTTIIANNWGIHNDPKYWPEPEKFDPRRFLTEDGKEVIMKIENYVPFSYGRRNCPGEVIALMEILLYFTALMQNFTIMAPEGQTIYLDGKLGLTYHPRVQAFRFIPRE